MPDEDDLRDLFAKADAPNRLDTAKIVARSRARRVPKQLAAGTLGALAVVGIVIGGVQVAQFAHPISSTMVAGAGDSQSDGAVPEAYDTIKRAPAEKINLCTGPLADVAPSAYGLQLDVAFPATAPVGDDSVQGMVTLTNTSATQVTGYTAAAPAITLSQDGVVLWHSNGAMIMSAVEVDLAPGESLEYGAFFVPARCGVEDDLQEAFSSDLVPVGPGTYELSAAIDFTPGSFALADSTGPDLVTGPRSQIVLQ